MLLFVDTFAVLHVILQIDTDTPIVRQILRSIYIMGVT